MATKNLPVTIDEALSSDKVLAYLADPDSVQIELFKEDPDEVRRRIESQVMGADSLDALLGGREVIQGKSFVNKPFQVRSVDWQQSTIEGGEGLPFYAVCSILLPDGSIETLTCGARSVVQKLAIIQSRGWLPADVVIVEDTTANGYKVLDLAKAADGLF